MSRSISKILKDKSISKILKDCIEAIEKPKGYRSVYYATMFIDSKREQKSIDTAIAFIEYFKLIDCDYWWYGWFSELDNIKNKEAVLRYLREDFTPANAIDKEGMDLIVDHLEEILCG